MRRRDFLALSAGTLWAASSGRAFGVGGAPWGDAPDDLAQSLLLKDGVRAEKVLELFLYGGVGPFETFYVVEDYGRPEDPDFPNSQWYLWKDDHDAVFDNCGLNSEERLTPFGIDALGKQVHLGPALAPFKARPDILSRMRIIVQRHALEPHEAAIPLALSGQRLGSPRMAGIGAAAQRFYGERDTSGRRIPYSYVLYPDNEISTDNIRAASSVGLHPGSARPLDLRISSAYDLEAWLSRSNLQDRQEAYDALLAHYANAAQSRYGRRGNPVRASGLADYRFATESLRNSEALGSVLPQELLEAVSQQLCGLRTREDTTAMGLNLATHLLTHPTAPARHVTVVDGGMIAASGGGGYDVHSRHLPDQTRNLYSTLSHLVSHINEPGENDPSKVNLDDTMIVLNTEFGRTPFAQDFTQKGTNHHPYGYVTVMIGGPVEEDQAGIVGAIGPDGWADRYVTPTESRAAIMAAMGIYPFHQETFAVGDLRGRAQEKDGLVWLNEIVLGRARS